MNIYKFIGGLLILGAAYNFSELRNDFGYFSTWGDPERNVLVVILIFMSILGAFLTYWGFKKDK